MIRGAMPPCFADRLVPCTIWYQSVLFEDMALNGLPDFGETVTVAQPIEQFHHA